MKNPESKTLIRLKTQIRFHIVSMPMDLIFMY